MVSAFPLKGLECLYIRDCRTKKGTVGDGTNCPNCPGGLFWPAHVDRGSNSLLTVLGAWPRELKADAVEVLNSGIGGIPILLKRVRTSDAHSFREMQDEAFPLPLKSADFAGLAAYLRGSS